jgi:hypothetical protein
MAMHDIRSTPVGGFAGPIGPNAPVGIFASPVVLGRQAAGGFAGEPDQQRQGSFAEVEYVASVTYEDKIEMPWLEHAARAA